jgi:N-methylhydantoinase A
VDGVREAFYQAYGQIYGYVDRETPVQITDLRVQIVGVTPKPAVAPPGRRSGGAAADAHAHRQIVWATSRLTAAVFDRAVLESGTVVTGPAVIDQDDTTTVVPPGVRMRVDANGNLIGEAAR